MARPLDDYDKKRDFRRTPEPKPRKRGRRGAAPVFVVHRHDARALHYDLRLEIGGALASWAVPKGFSYDPKEKRLAVRTEDHPLEYETFEGVIPEGEYGAGAMAIWDHGHFEVLVKGAKESVAAGELKLRLFGRKLRGEWHMVRMDNDRESRAGKDKKKENWLVFKSRDRYAGPGRDSALGIDLARAPERPLPRTVRFMEPADEVEPFSDPDWLFEMAFEGERVLCEKDGERVRLRGVRAKLPAIEAALGELHAETALLDGTLVALGADERPSAELLRSALAGRDGAPVHYYAFDLLHYDEFDLRPLSTLERKAALRAVLPSGTPLLHVDHVHGDGERLAEAVRAAGLPGLVAKRADAAYASGPSADWRKVRVAPERSPRKGKVSASLARPAAERTRSRVRLTNLDKVYWPAEGLTKGDLVGWYERVAHLVLPYLRDRPVHMNRFPDGIEGKSFYQRQAKEDLPEWFRTVPIESGGETLTQLLCDDLDSLLWLANQGSIDLHPWLSRVGSLDSPDFAVLDLDPKSAPFRDVVAVAQACRRILEEIGLASYPKTSGKTGLHVFVPLEAGYTYDQSAMFCEAVARAVCRELPEIATVERNPAARGGKVYVDFLQNRRSQTVVPPYVPRPVAGATVSAPLAWDEVAKDLTPARFTLQTMPARIERAGDLFAPVLADRQDLGPAILALERRFLGA